jgi:hypothetical protein
MPVNITIKQGKTFTRVFSWAAEPVVFKAITAIPRTAPAQVTCPAHGMPAVWMTAIESVVGMVEINSENDPPRASDYMRAETVDPNTVRLPDVNAAEFSAYVSGGYLRFYTPVDMAGYTARMKIKSRPGGTEYASLTSPGDIVIDDVAKTITVTITAAATALFTFPYGVRVRRVRPGVGEPRRRRDRDRRR